LPYDGALTLPRVLTWSEACGCLLARFAPDLEALRVGEPLAAEASDQRLAFVGDGLADAAELRLAVDRPADAKNFYRCVVQLSRRRKTLMASVWCNAPDDRGDSACAVGVEDALTTAGLASRTRRDANATARAQARYFESLTLPDRRLRERSAHCAMSLTLRGGEPLAFAIYVDGSLVEWDVGGGRTACAHRWYDALDAPADDALRVSAVAHGPRAGRREPPFAAHLTAWRLAPAFREAG
jgi:hypothetical protein